MKKNGKFRIRLLLAVCTAAFALFLVRLIWMQFVMAGHYAEKVTQAGQTRYTVTVPAARGSITDRNGTVLAQDTAVYSLSLCVPAPPGTDLETTLATLYQLGLGGKDVETQLAAFCSAVSAGQMPLASSITEEQRAALLASGLPQSGAVVLTARGQRTWPAGSAAPHLLGATGPMTAEQWQNLQDSGLAMDAENGQWGAEAAYEELLRGQDGVLTVTADRSTGARYEELTRVPQEGNTLVLSLDADLQRVVRQALLAQMETLRTTKPAGKGKEVRAAAAVVVDAATGGVLAAVSLPDYDLVQWRQNYAALASDPGAPLVDRTLTGLYAPGSAFKPAVAAAALAAGLITPNSTVSCTGRYLYYAGYQPRCLQLGHSGTVDLLTALRQSCNIYFYDVGRRLGVDGFSSTAQLLGLGVPTGAELPEAAGTLTWSEDGNYQAGLTLMAAIGQGNTAVTPAQLAAYACSLARSGSRPALHFAEKALDSEGNCVWQWENTELSCAPGGEAVFAPIREGMKQMAETLRVLRESPIPLACKTGSPQLAARMANGTHYTNSVLIGYGPADDAQFAAAIVLEYGGGGSNAAPVMRAIADWWNAAHPQMNG